jgi:glycosyltransferase involved in cell wall biosynthesis
LSGFIIATNYGNKSVPNYFFALGQELARRGHPVLLLVDGRREDAEIPTGNPRVLTWPSFRPTTLRDASFLHRHIRELRPTAVVANFGAVNVSLLTSFLARVPVRVAWYHTLSRQLDLDHPETAWKRRAQAWRKKQVYRFATRLVAVSEAARADLETSFGVPAKKTLALPLLLPEPPPLDVHPGAEREKVICVGRLDASKGQATLIRAFAAVREAVPQASLELLGEGPARPEYEALAETLGIRAACDFPGWLPFEEAMRRLAAARVAVVSSRAEALGLAAVEALSVGVPVVASRVDGLTEIVVDGQTGYLVEPGDAKGLAERIVTLLSDESTRRRLGENARRRFRDVFSTAGIGRHADALEALGGG